MRTLSRGLILGLIGASACAMQRTQTNAMNESEVELCSVNQGTLAYVPGTVDKVSGDTMLFGRPLGAVYQDADSPFAIGKAWFQSHKPVEYNDRTFYKNFPPRRFRVGEVTRIGEFEQTPLFVDFGAPTLDPSIVYVLVSADCLFQAYFYTQ